MTGGLVHSVCETDYSAPLEGIGQSVVELRKTVTLTCPPVEGYPIGVTKDGQPFSMPFQVAGVNLIFDDVLPEGNYQFQYSCLE